MKRSGHRESFDERKVYASVYAACLNAHLKEQECESIAEQVTEKVKEWISTKKEVDSKKISEQVFKYLEQENSDAAFLYKTHLDLS